MMMSPDCFIVELKYKSYAELLPVRDRLIREIHSFEKHSKDTEAAMIHPSPEVIYQCNLMYLGKLCELIAEKYNEEYIRGKTE